MEILAVSIIIDLCMWRKYIEANMEMRLNKLLADII